MGAIEENVHGVASAIIDPETGKHAEVIVRRTGKETLQLRTNGSQAFARELERRLDFESGTVETSNSDGPVVYLAHAWEDKADLAEPLARILIENGIDVWLDKWEIRSGDSLRQKMDEGLEDCSHFMVLLTENSISKPWVNSEIDAGFIKDLEGSAKFIGLRCGLEVEALSPLLKTKLCRAIDIDDDSQVEMVIKDIYEQTGKPPLGGRSSFVSSQEDGLAGWSPEAVALAKHLVINSPCARKYHGHTDIEECHAAIGGSVEDIRLGLLDLADAGLIIRDEYSADQFQPDIGLFVEFDRYFMEFDNRQDARELAKLVLKQNQTRFDCETVRALVPDWTVRRLNSALNVLEEVKAINAERYLGACEFTCNGFGVTDKMLRYARRS